MQKNKETATATERKNGHQLNVLVFIQLQIHIFNTQKKEMILITSIQGTSKHKGTSEKQEQQGNVN